MADICFYSTCAYHAIHTAEPDTAACIHASIGHSVQEEEDRAVAQLHSLTGRGGEQAFQARLQSGVQTVLTVCLTF